MLNVALLVALVVVCSGISPRPDAFSVELTGGCTVVLKPKGQSLHHWLETPEKERVDWKNGKYWFMFNDGSFSGEEFTCTNQKPSFDRSQVKLKTVSKLSASKSMSKPQESTQLHTGTLKNLVIMIQWKGHDVSDIPVSKYESLFNLPLGSKDDNAPTGSVKDYFFNQSYGKLTIESTLSPWIQSSYTMAEASGGSGCHATCEDPDFTLQQAIMEAIGKFEEIVGADVFKTFDEDNDGYVDMMTVVHSGRPAEVGGNTDLTEFNIWSHKWVLITSYTNPLKKGYKAPLSKLNFLDYNINAGRWLLQGMKDSSDITHLGVVVHECTHFLGLPDFYDTDSSSSGVGKFDLMADAWGPDFDQRLFTSLSGPSKYFLGWLNNITTIYRLGETLNKTVFSLDTIQISGNVIKIELSADEFLMIENRQPIGVDSLLYGGGLLVFHVDESYVKEENLPGFNTGANSLELDYQSPDTWSWQHPGLRVVQADGLFELEQAINGGNAGDFFGTNSDVGLSDSALPKPNINSYAKLGSASTMAISDVSVSGPSMQFSFGVSNAPENSKSKSPTASEATSNPTLSPSLTANLTSSRTANPTSSRTANRTSSRTADLPLVFAFLLTLIF